MPTANDFQFNAALFANRRAQLLAQLLPNSVCVIATAPELIRNRDAHYPYRFDSSFYYLTGFAEPLAVMVLSNVADAPAYTLFCRERDPERELWDGIRAGTLGAVESYGACAAKATETLETCLATMLQSASQVYTRFGIDLPCATQIPALIHQLYQRSRTGVQVPHSMINIDVLIDEMRLTKDSAEIQLMQGAANISAAAHVRTMQAAHAGIAEYALQAEFEYHCKQHGAQLAYNSIVASGHNACILHYTSNNAVLQDGDLVLIDAGAELHGYAADITRTFPVSGRFSPAQATLYNLVLKAQLAAIDTLLAGVCADVFHQTATKVLVEGLLELGLLSGTVDSVLADGSYKAFYMHGTGHYLGLDVHDVGAYTLAGASSKRQLLAGMVLTVEPGLYVAADNMTVDAKWRGIGIRIEDDVLITETGCHVLTHAVPKTIEAIEALMAKG